MSPILVTGGTGFLGRAVVDLLLAKGHHVAVLSRGGASAARSAQMIVHDGGTETLVASIRRLKPAACFHLAALFIAEHTPAQVAPLVEANILLTAQLAEALVASECRHLVVADTCWRHAGSDRGHPANLYAASKAAAQALLSYHADAHQLHQAWLRLGDTYGPGDTRGKLVSRLIESSRTGTPLLLSKGEQLLSLLHSRDAASAMYACLVDLQLTPGPAVRAWSAAARETISLKDLVSAVEAATQGKVPAVLGARPYRAREVMRPAFPDPPPPDWRQDVSLADGLRELAREGRDG